MSTVFLLPKFLGVGLVIFRPRVVLSSLNVLLRLLSKGGGSSFAPPYPEPGARSAMSHALQAKDFRKMYSLLATQQSLAPMQQKIFVGPISASLLFLSSSPHIFLSSSPAIMNLHFRLGLRRQPATSTRFPLTASGKHRPFFHLSSSMLRDDSVRVWNRESHYFLWRCMSLLR